MGGLRLRRERILRENGSKVDNREHVPCSNSREVRRFQRERIIVFDRRWTHIRSTVDGDTSEVDGISGSVATSVEAVSARNLFPVTVSLHHYGSSTVYVLNDGFEDEGGGDQVEGGDDVECND